MNLVDSTNSIISNVDLLEDNVFTAYFNGSAIEQLLTISEINYHSPNNLNTKDWVELHNYGTEEIDISGYTIKDERLYNGFVIPEGTIILPDQYIVIVENIDSFALIHPTIEVLGPLDFSFDNSGEIIYLYNNRGELVQQIEYDDEIPWDTYADGSGGTLELLTYGTDVKDGNNWESICDGGSPLQIYDSECPLNLANHKLIAFDYMIYPNPAQDVLYLGSNLLAETTSLSIYTLDGRLIDSVVADSQVDVVDFEAGVYILKAVLSDKELVFQFVKE